MNNVLINGEKKETISILDRGLHYGDGLFETMAYRKGKIPLWDAHWERLQHSCKRLSMILPDREKIEQEILSLNELSDKKTNHIIKLIITRGEGQRGYRFSKQKEVTRILISYPYSNYPETYTIKGVSVRYCETILSENKKLAGIKHLNRLEQVLARNEWGDSEQADDFQEGLMLTAQGYVIDGTMSNVFAVKDNNIFTPDLSLCGVSGVMRKTIMTLAKKNGYFVDEKFFTPDELEMADEIFLSNSLFGIWPVRKIAQTTFTKVGAITSQLQKELKKELGE